MFKRLKYIFSGEFIVDTNKITGEIANYIYNLNDRITTLEKVNIELAEEVIDLQGDIDLLQKTISTSITSLSLASGVKPDKLYKAFDAEKINQFKEKMGELIDKHDSEC